MIRILLADDEPIIVKGLKKLLPWKNFQADIVGEAFDGNQAEQLLFQLRPDILVSDICMPGKTGIELLKSIKKSQLPTKVIFLSGYQEFSYARDAVTFGALGYIIKPVDKTQLEQTIRKAILLIDKEVEEVNLRNKLSSYENERKNTYRETLLARLIHGYGSLQELSEDYSAYGIDIKRQFFMVLSIEIDDLAEKKPSLSLQEVQLIQYSVLNWVHDFIQNIQTGNVFFKDDLLIVILNHESVEQLLQTSRTIAGSIKEEVKNNLHQTISIGIGETVSNIEDIRKSYFSSLKALERKFFSGNGSINDWDGNYKNEFSEEDLYLEQKKLRDALITNEKEILDHSLSKIENIIRDLSHGNKESAIRYVLWLTNNLSRELSNIGLYPAWVNKKGNDDLNKVTTFEELTLGLFQYIQEILGHIRINTKGKEVQDIKKVNDYIENNFQQNVTLESVAAIACMNPNYFSTFYKKHTGQNFKDYLLKVRMERAIKILLTTDCKTYEIAEQVGFNDPKHFSDMFKKYYQKNPMEYKRDMQNAGLGG